jgi:general secretion pathway protein I
MSAAVIARCPRAQRGFTLLEVMLAFVVLAAAMGLLMGMLSGGLRQVARAELETGAALHAQTLLDQLGTIEAIEPGTREGELDGGRYRYRMDIAPTEDPAPVEPSPGAPQAVPQQGAPELFAVSLAVTWGEGDDPSRQFRVATLRARTPTVLQGTPR